MEDVVDPQLELARLYDVEIVLRASQHRFYAETLYYEGNEPGSWLELFYWGEECSEFGKNYSVDIRVN